MRLGVQLLIVIALGLVLAMFLPWWSIAIAGFAAGFLIHEHHGRSFLGGFLGSLILWASAAIVITLRTGSPLADMFAKLLPIRINGIGLAFVAGIIAGIVAGFGGMAGDAMRRAIFAKPKRR
jgi:hypothetical protein